jgi:hypothetical protein
VSSQRRLQRYKIKIRRFKYGVPICTEVHYMAKVEYVYGLPREHFHLWSASLVSYAPVNLRNARAHEYEKITSNRTLSLLKKLAIHKAALWVRIENRLNCWARGSGSGLTIRIPALGKLPPHPKKTQKKGKVFHEYPVFKIGIFSLEGWRLLQELSLLSSKMRYTSFNDEKKIYDSSTVNVPNLI